MPDTMLMIILIGSGACMIGWGFERLRRMKRCEQTDASCNFSSGSPFVWFDYGANSSSDGDDAGDVGCDGGDGGAGGD